MAHFGDSEGHSSTSDVSLVDGCWMRVAGNCFAFGLESAPRFKPPRTPSRMDSKIATHSVKEVRDNEKTKPKSESKVQRLGLPSVSKIAAMAAGTDHAVVCLADQTLFSTGSNSFGQLGIGLDGTTQKAFAALDIRLPVVSVACGKAHTIMATLYGEMYSCGNNTSGQLGLGNYEDRLALTRSDLSDYNVMSVAAGEPPHVCVLCVRACVCVLCVCVRVSVVCACVREKRWDVSNAINQGMSPMQSYITSLYHYHMSNKTILSLSLFHSLSLSPAPYLSRSLPLFLLLSLFLSLFLSRSLSRSLPRTLSRSRSLSLCAHGHVYMHICNRRQPHAGSNETRSAILLRKQ